MDQWSSFWGMHLGHVILHQSSRSHPLWIGKVFHRQRNSLQTSGVHLTLLEQNDVGKAMGKPTNQRLVVNIIRHWGFTRFHHFELSKPDWKQNPVATCVGTLQHEGMTYPTTTSNAVVALSFCSLLEQGAKDAPRTAGDWGWNVKPQSADMPPNVLRGIACDNFGHGLFDFILLWHYSCARQNIASVLNIFRRHQLRNQGNKHMRLTNMNDLTRCR